MEIRAQEIKADVKPDGEKGKHKDQNEVTSCKPFVEVQAHGDQSPDSDFRIVSLV